MYEHVISELTEWFLASLLIWGGFIFVSVLYFMAANILKFIFDLKSDIFQRIHVVAFIGIFLVWVGYSVPEIFKRTSEEYYHKKLEYAASVSTPLWRRKYNDFYVRKKHNQEVADGIKLDYDVDKYPDGFDYDSEEWISDGFDYNTDFDGNLILPNIITNPKNKNNCTDTGDTNWNGDPFWICK